MILNNFAQPSFYPFTTDSSRILYENYKLPVGMIYGALLCPRLATDVILHVSRIHTDPISSDTEFRQHWCIADETGTDICDVLFSNRSDTLPTGLQSRQPATGYALQNGEYCGVLRGTSMFYAFAKLLPMELELNADALVFDPATVRIRHVNGFSDMLLEQSPVRGIIFDSDVFDVSEDGTVSVQSNIGVSSTQRPITALKVVGENGVLSDAMTGESIALVSDIGSSIKIVTTTNDIQIGRAMDFL